MLTSNGLRIDASAAEPDANRLRRAQVDALAARSWVMAAGSVGCCVLVVASFWRSAPQGYLLGLLSFLSLVHSAALLAGHLWRRRVWAGVSQLAARLRADLTILAALAWISVPIALMPRAAPEQRDLVICVMTGIVSSSVLLAPFLRTALVFAGIVSLGTLLSILRLQDGEIVTATAFAAFALMTIGFVISHGRGFAARVHERESLKKQGDIIGLLLRDFDQDEADFVWETDRDHCLRGGLHCLAKMLDCRPAALNGQSLLDCTRHGAETAGPGGHDHPKFLAHLTGQHPFRNLQLSIACKGRRRWVSMTGMPVLDAAGAFQGYRGVGTDITELRHATDRIKYLAEYDCLTGLPNRGTFQEKLRSACGEARPFALLYIDLDGFKTVNDTLGHNVGDKLLVAAAGRLRSCVLNGDLVARLGGDEFAVVQSNGDAASAGALARRIIDRTSEPYLLGETSCFVGLSIGIALASGEPTAEDLLKGADLALYRAKAGGRGTWQFFDDAMAHEAYVRHALRVELRQAIDRQELTLEFQPVFDLASMEITTAEALVRWRHPVRGQIPPADFIPIAEEAGLIDALGAWVLRRACQQAMSWDRPARVAVNLSPLQFRDPELLASIDAILAETGLTPHRLELEITESVLLDAEEATLSCLRALRSRGIRIALDDFGTGYSSLSYLRSFPFNKVKIDQSFVHDLSDSEEASAIVRAILAMAGSLGLRSTAEGVETWQQADLLSSMGCHEVQGFLFGRPCSERAIAELMAGVSSGRALQTAGE